MKNKLTLVVKDITVEKGLLGDSVNPDILYIKGYANRYLDNMGQLVIDRSRESVLPTGYNLDNFLKNPILLSYHDRYEPVGKIVDVKITIDGLEITAEVHKILNPKVFYAVEQGILKTFSIGFKAIDAKYDAENDIYYYREVELLEVSIVSVPDNQESIFTVLTQSPCANGTCMLASKATGEHTYKCASKIKNKSLSVTKWSEVDKSELSASLSEEIPEVIKEAYLIVGATDKSSSWKFPHHEYKEGSLFVSKEGVMSAFSALKSIKTEDKYSKEEKLEACTHLLKHFEEMKEVDDSVVIPEDLKAWILELENDISITKEETSTGTENTNDNKTEEGSEHEPTPGTQNAEGSTQTAEGNGKESDTVTFEQVLSFIEAAESSDIGVSQLLSLHQSVEARVNSLLKT